MKTKIFILLISFISSLVFIVSCFACATENQIEIIFSTNNGMDMERLKEYCSEESCVFWQGGKKIAYLSSYHDKAIVTIEDLGISRIFSFKLTIPTLAIQETAQGKHYYIDPKFDSKKFNWAQAVRQDLKILIKEEILNNVTDEDISDIVNLLESNQRAAITIYYRADSCARDDISGGLISSGWVIQEGENCIQNDSGGCPTVYPCDCPRYIYFRKLPVKKIEDFNF